MDFSEEIERLFWGDIEDFDRLCFIHIRYVRWVRLITQKMHKVHTNYPRTFHGRDHHSPSSTGPILLNSNTFFQKGQNMASFNMHSDLGVDDDISYQIRFGTLVGKLKMISGRIFEFVPRSKYIASAILLQYSGHLYNFRLIFSKDFVKKSTNFVLDLKTQILSRSDPKSSFHWNIRVIGLIFQLLWNFGNA